MKKTAVEFIIEQFDLTSDSPIIKNVVEQAKEMEKEQIKEGYIMSLLDRDNKIRRDAEQYYNETYKSE